MNENIDLTKIFKDCPRGTEFYSSIFGKVTFLGIDNLNPVYPILVKISFGINQSRQFTKQGKYYAIAGECTLFPSEDQRDWSKFTTPWYKKKKFNPKTLKPFDKVLVRDFSDDWNCEFFSHVIFSDVSNQYATIGNYYQYCIPYDENTKHLVGTNEEAPEFYRYWED